MQNAGFELPRILILRTSVNKGESILSTLTIHRDFIENSSPTAVMAS
jgi:hypothetical protein